MPRRAALVLTAILLASSALTACSTSGPASGPASGAKAHSGGAITMGFAQVGAESGWRTANTKSVQEAAKKAGIDLKFSDAQQKQENQIKAIRTFIQQKVDVIAFSPVVESGWDTVLKEAKDAGIPVILTDRAVDTKDTSLYKAFLGSDFVKEGKSAGEWLTSAYANEQGTVNIVELQGTTGSAPANDRRAGFADVIRADGKFKIVASQSGDFTRAKGKEVMQAFLKSQKDIDVLYAHNDDMALGAIQAIEESGKKPGTDIKVISVDGIKDAFVAMTEGKINVVVECNPLLGDQLMELAKKVVAGESVPTRVETQEGVFPQDKAAAALPSRNY
ncbi:MULTISPECIES: ABC transporter substrate-binding protein [unclassified Streptomyces]|uniref:ABC transporter substrate-binding protein n=1 Tax=unclassified Streptomyces TaxID=2593676 RepID=UPI002E3678EC|nr:MULTISPECIES: ABC transporter substrate-binding protein [unclassified Streptomyces]WUC62985.1 ABC transporter substrate-binding protein [Streptomyces sp. NBC_00539]